MSRRSQARPSNGRTGSKDDQLDAVFSALADRTRRRILARLAGGPASVTEIAHPFSMTLPAVSKHLRVLERAGLLRRQRDGWYHRCHFDGRPLSVATEVLQQYRSFWEDTLDELARYVERRAVRPSARRSTKKAKNEKEKSS